MARPLSVDLRERIVRAVESGSSRREAAEQFAVSDSAAIKLVRRWERTGSVAPGKIGGHKQHALREHEAVVRALVAAQADITLEELKARLAEQGIVVGRSSVDRFLKALGLTRKKRRSTPPSRSAPTSPRHARPGASGRAS